MSRPLSARLARVVERDPLSPVADEDRRNWFFLLTVKVGVMICVPLFALGGQFGTGMRWLDLAPAVVVGSVVTAILATWSGLVGMQARVPTAVLVSRTFGTLGGKAVAAILIVTLWGWFGVQTEVLVHSLQALAKASLGYAPDRLVLTLSCGALISSTAIIGVRALGKVSYVAVPLLLAVIAVPTAIALQTHDWRPLLGRPPLQAAFDFGSVVSVIVGGHIVAIAITPDITRFMRGRADTIVGIWLGYGFTLPLLLLLAALLALVYASADLVAIMVATGVGVPALAVIVLATWTANDKNLYETSLSMSLLAPRVERWKLTVAAAVIGTSLAAAGIFSHFIALLVFMGITIGPVAGIYLVDHALVPGRYRELQVPRLRIRPCAAWVVGVAVGVLTQPRGQGGVGLFTLTSASTIDALLGGLLAQAAFEWLALRRARGPLSSEQTDGLVTLPGREKALPNAD